MTARHEIFDRTRLKSAATSVVLEAFNSTKGWSIPEDAGILVTVVEVDHPQLYGKGKLTINFEVVQMKEGDEEDDL